MSHKRRTKIVATLGPASIPKIKQLIIAGANVFRLNFSHIKDPSSQDHIIKTIRDTSAELCIPVAILGDLGGPKIRCNEFTTPSIILETDGNIDLVAAPSNNPDYLGNSSMIVTPVATLVEQLEVGNRVLLDDGYIQLQVVEKKSLVLQGSTVLGAKMLIVTGGELKPKKGINVPEVKLGIAALTQKDKIDAAYMHKMKLDYVALSFVQKPQDVKDLLDLFESLGGERPWIISKIEKPQALDSIDEILKLTDGIMVARGDLGVEVSLEQVPIYQKMLIKKCNNAEKPVITATQMLESMIHSPTPTRAEVSDVANAVFDGTDAVMLSAECATGEFPIEAVKMMSTICKSAEQNLEFSLTHNLQISTDSEKSPFVHSVADAAVFSAAEANAVAIIVFTSTGETPIYVSKKRPKMPIVALTAENGIYQKLALFYGIYPMLSDCLSLRSIDWKDSQTNLNSSLMVPLHENTDSVLAQAEKDIVFLQEKQDRRAKDAKQLQSTSVSLIKENDVVVFCAGNHKHFFGLSNTVKLCKFGNYLRYEALRDRWRFAARNSVQKLNES